MQSRKRKGAYGRTTEYALRGLGRLGRLGRLAGDMFSLQISRGRGRWMDGKGREGILWGSMGGWIGGWFWITRSVERWMDGYRAGRWGIAFWMSESWILGMESIRMGIGW